jgi:hypothetical protein
MKVVSGGIKVKSGMFPALVTGSITDKKIVELDA